MRNVIPKRMTASACHREEEFGVNVLNSMRELQQQGVWCDARITCNDGTVLLVHRLLLAAVSPYFRDKFAEQYVDINVLFGADVMAQLVKYCYSGEITISVKIALDVYFAARKFQLGALLATAERHLVTNLESVVHGDRFRALDEHQLQQLVECLPLSSARHTSALLRGLLDWLEQDQSTRLGQYVSVMAKLGTKYGPREYCNIKALAPPLPPATAPPAPPSLPPPPPPPTPPPASAPRPSLQQQQQQQQQDLAATIDVEPTTIDSYHRSKYALIRGRVYSYHDNDLQELDATWKDLACESSRQDCALVIPLCAPTGLFLAGYRVGSGGSGGGGGDVDHDDDENEDSIRLDRLWHGGRIGQGTIRSVSLNQMYAVDGKRRIRSLRVDSGRPLMAQTGHRVPSDVDDVCNISPDAYGRLLIYGRVDGQRRALVYAAPDDDDDHDHEEDWLRLTLEAPERLANALDVVHVPGTQVVYQVWSGHIEEMLIGPDHHLPRSPKRTIFMPTNCRVDRVLHPFCDTRGIVVLVQDVWSASRHSVLRYHGDRWEILLAMDGYKLAES